MTPNDALLLVVAELRIDVAQRDAQIEDLRAQVADLRKHHAECANNDEDK